MIRNLLIALIVLIVAETGLAIHCWQCNSHHNADCATLPSGPQDRTKLADNIRNYYVDCDALNDPFAGKYNLCRKQEQDIEQKETRIIRSCGFETSGKECYKTANPSVKTHVCECREDGCNSSSSLSSNQILLFLSLLYPFLLVLNVFTK